jgi:uncharacterized protein
MKQMKISKLLHLPSWVSTLTCIAAILLCSLGQATAQRFILKGAKVDGEIKLLWTPSGAEAWHHMATSGRYIIQRFSYAQAGVQTTPASYIQSKTVINIDSAVAANGALESKVNLIYDLLYQAPASPTASPSLADAVEARDDLETKYLVVTKLAEQDIQCAIAAKMGYIDTLVQKDASYAYQVLWIHGADTSYSNLIIIKENEVPPIWSNGLYHENKPGSVHISWLHDIDLSPYSYYDIYRRKLGSGTNYTKLNPEPYVFFAPENEKKTAANYVDSTLHNSGVVDLDDYEYKVEGHTYFGQTATSPIDTAHALPILPPQIADIDTVLYDISSANLHLVINAEAAPHIANLHLYELPNVEAEGTLLQTLAPSVRDIAVPYKPQGTQYYIAIELIKDYGIYYTPLTLVQYPDSSPPAKPATPEGNISSAGEVTLLWQPNTEPDLLGYNLYYTNLDNGADATYTRINDEPIPAPNYKDYLDQKITNEMIYYKISALDYRHNESPLSDVAMLARPDNALYAAVITNLNAQKGGIRIAWTENSPAKIIRYKLQRKAAAIAEWSTIKSWAPDSLKLLPLIPEEKIAPRYIDKDTLEHIKYVYRVVSISTAGTTSYSAERAVEPYDDGIRGVISGLNFAPRGIIDDKHTSTQIGWQYSTKYSHSIKEFKVYVRYNDTSDPGYYLLKTIPARRYNTAANGLAGNGPAAYSITSPLPTQSKGVVASNNYSFKIVALHYDGGHATYEGGAKSNGVDR